ncbi:MAG: RDD family protein [Taibaiella sp.]|nr:RDD family protein [Taibaiella sp.]
MTILAINTTQNVNINFTTASVGERLVAYILDAIILFCYYFLVSILVNQFFQFDDQWSYIGLMMFLMLPMMFYTLIFESLMNGQTPGKRVMKIKVVKIDGFEAGFTDYISRWLMRLIDITFTSGVAAVISIVLSERNQRLGDMVAGTAVISLKQRTGLYNTIQVDLHESYVPIFPAAQFLSDKDATIIKSNFETAYRDGNYDLFYKLRVKIEDVLHIQKGNMSDLEFINVILKDFNYFTGKL